MLNKQFLGSTTLLFVIAAVYIVTQINHTFTLKKISCTTDLTGTCPDYIQAELNKNLGKSIFQVDMAAQLLKISTYQPSLHQYQFTQQLPATISVNFSSAKAAYALKTNNGGKLLIIDETGTVIEETDQSSLITIEVTPELFQNLNLRSSLDSNLNQALSNVISELNEKRISTTKIQLINPDELALELSDQKVAQLSTQNVISSIDKLAYILENMNVKSVKQPIKTIDLRFKYPVLKT